ncbi:MAG TPA: 6-carboxytetrahydropterin synthase [Pyrinomonadaceae bacterium]|nr:6-carboxytetrahydropterin synthase [Pyrinomonadaceae bacterium]
MKAKFILTKTFPFEAAHQLKYHDGKCARLHGHSFKLTIVISGKNTVPELIREPEVPLNQQKPAKDPKSNMLLDYGEISAIVKPFVESHLDHHFLNDTLETESPTSEYIASYCFGYLSGEFRKAGVKLKEIRISETCTSEAIYRVK